MQALFIGQTYIDVTLVADQIPTGDEKDVARDYAVSFGGNAVTAAFCCAKLGIPPDLLTTLADDWLGRMFLDMAAKYQVSVHGRKVQRSSLSFVIPKGDQRAILRARDDRYLHPCPPLNLAGCRALHLDGHMPDAAIQYAMQCREAGILTSLDGGGLRVNTMELLSFIDVAVVSERFCEQLNMSSAAVLDLLKTKGCKIGGITQGARGHSLVRRKRHGPDHAGARRAGARNRRHQRRGRRVPRCLCLLLSRAARTFLGCSFPLRARGLGARHPLPRKRGAPAGRSPTSKPPNGVSNRLDAR